MDSQQRQRSELLVKLGKDKKISLSTKTLKLFHRCTGRMICCSLRISVLSHFPPLTDMIQDIFNAADCE